MKRVLSAGCLLLLLPGCGYGQGVAGGGSARGAGSMSAPAVTWVSLTWTASPSPSIAGYNVYRSQTSGSGYTKMNSTLVASLAYNDTSVTPGQTYYYVATAVGTTGGESAFSNQATATIPSP
jgi:fibronectin type 3 domain-containing protein